MRVAGRATIIGEMLAENVHVFRAAGCDVCEHRYRRPETPEIAAGERLRSTLIDPQLRAKGTVIE
jgi:hypothetical protein